MSALRIGVLSAADIAVRRILPALRDRPDVRLAAVASRDPAKARRVADAFDCAAVTGYAKLLERDDVDAVYVPLPPGLHTEWVSQALAAGKHVLVEKPATVSVTDTARLTRQAAAQGLVLRENYMFPHHAQHRAVRDLISRREIGRVRSLTATFTIPPRDPADIRYQAALGGGALFDLGGYPVRVARYFLGSDLTVLAAGLRTGAGTDDPVDVAGHAVLCTTDGVLAHLTFGLDGPYRSEYRIAGSRGEIEVNRAFTPPADHPPEITVTRSGGSERLALPPDDQVGNALGAFLRAIREGDSHADAGIVRQAQLVEEIRRRACPAQPAVRSLTRPSAVPPVRWADPG
ncbi:Gfo/Idh/MocA family oxidoreductase [Actinoplanes sp. NPDC048967]|uniref:Gfo/Idh/MocA family protein n=1 Tax=Actinoplanes sp. NPDC048967 TaxID=3155269 RepID=UPI0033EDB333